MQAHQPTKWESNAHRIGKISVCSLDVRDSGGTPKEILQNYFAKSVASSEVGNVLRPL